MGSINNIAFGNGGSGSSTTWIWVCIGCMCTSYIAAAIFIYVQNKDTFVPHNEEQLYWGS